MVVINDTEFYVVHCQEDIIRCYKVQQNGLRSLSYTEFERIKHLILKQIARSIAATFHHEPPLKKLKVNGSEWVRPINKKPETEKNQVVPAEDSVIMDKLKQIECIQQQQTQKIDKKVQHINASLKSYQQEAAQIIDNKVKQFGNTMKKFQHEASQKFDNKLKQLQDVNSSTMQISNECNMKMNTFQNDINTKMKQFTSDINKGMAIQSASISKFDTKIADLASNTKEQFSTILYEIKSLQHTINEETKQTKKKRKSKPQRRRRKKSKIRHNSSDEDSDLISTDEDNASQSNKVQKRTKTKKQKTKSKADSDYDPNDDGTQKSVQSQKQKKKKTKKKSHQQTKQQSDDENDLLPKEQELIIGNKDELHHETMDRVCKHLRSVLHGSQTQILANFKNIFAGKLKWFYAIHLIKEALHEQIRQSIETLWQVCGATISEFDLRYEECQKMNKYTRIIIISSAQLDDMVVEKSYLVHGARLDTMFYMEEAMEWMEHIDKKSKKTYSMPRHISFVEQHPDLSKIKYKSPKKKQKQKKKDISIASDTSSSRSTRASIRNAKKEDDEKQQSNNNNDEKQNQMTMILIQMIRIRMKTKSNKQITMMLRI